MENGWRIQSHEFSSLVSRVLWLEDIGFIVHLVGTKDITVLRYSRKLYDKQRTVLQGIDTLGMARIVDHTPPPHALLLFFKNFQKCLLGLCFL